MSESYRLRYTNQIVGSFLAAFLLILFVVLIFTFRVREKENYSILIGENELGGLTKGAEVMILGEKAGSVKSLEYDEPTGKVRVTIGIERDKAKEIYEDSEVSLESKLGVGGSYLVIRRPAKPEQNPQRLEPGQELKNFQVQEDTTERLSNQIEQIKRSIQTIQLSSTRNLESVGSAANRMERSLDSRVDPALESSRDATDSFFKTSEEMRNATRNLERRMTELSDKVQLLLDRDVPETLAGVQESTSDLSAAAQSVNATSDHVDRDVAQTLAEMRLAIAQVEDLARESREVVRIIRQEANDLPGTTAQFNDTVSDTQELVGEIRSHWLLRRYSNQGKPSAQVPPSAVRGGSMR